jgi:antitoxin MazE
VLVDVRINIERRQHAAPAKELHYEDAGQEMGQQRRRAHPPSVLAASSIAIDQAVHIREEGGRIVIEPIKADPYELDALLDQMRLETFPEEADFGPTQGREMW